MIEGIGIDIVDLERIQKAMLKQERFANRILTERELDIYRKLSGIRKVEFLAGRFAAKEAYAKANGTGIGKDLSFLDMEVIPNEQGKPIMTAPTEHKIHVAISHDRSAAVAQVIIES